MIYKKKSKRLLALFISAAMAGSLCIPASAATVESNTPKEEAVYINLNADGSVREVNVVNIFELDGKEHVTDYGKYKSVRNMTTTDPLE